LNRKEQEYSKQMVIEKDNTYKNQER